MKNKKVFGLEIIFDVCPGGFFSGKGKFFIKKKREKRFIRRHPILPSLHPSLPLAVTVLRTPQQPLLLPPPRFALQSSPFLTHSLSLEVTFPLLLLFQLVLTPCCPLHQLSFLSYPAGFISPFLVPLSHHAPVPMYRPAIMASLTFIVSFPYPPPRNITHLPLSSFSCLLRNFTSSYLAFCPHPPSTHPSKPKGSINPAIHLTSFPPHLVSNLSFSFPQHSYLPPFPQFSA